QARVRARRTVHVDPARDEPPTGDVLPARHDDAVGDPAQPQGPAVQRRRADPARGFHRRRGPRAPARPGAARRRRAAPRPRAGLILDEGLGWPSGHPYLTQRLCAALVAAGSRDVTAVVDATLLQQHGDPLFAYTETAFDLYAGGPAGVSLVELYGRLLRGERV